MVLHEVPLFSAKLTDKLSFYDLSMNTSILVVRLSNLVEIKGIEKYLLIVLRLIKRRINVSMIGNYG